MKKPEKKREIKNKRKELKNKISSPLTNYLSLQTKKENKIFKPPPKKSDNKKIELKSIRKKKTIKTLSFGGVLLIIFLVTMTSLDV